MRIPAFERQAMHVARRCHVDVDGHRAADVRTEKHDSWISRSHLSPVRGFCKAMMDSGGSNTDIRHEQLLIGWRRAGG